ncbi:MAG: glycosyltransferase family A protein [Methylobacter sp.]|nr:glycosyltransferase family A protein [Methylobacter sp.]
MDLLNNSRFQNLQPKIDSFGFSLDGSWFIECSDQETLENLTVNTQSKKAGLIIRAEKVNGWVRLLQKIDPSEIFSHTLEFYMMATGMSGDDPGYTLDWIELLKSNENNSLEHFCRIASEVDLRIEETTATYRVAMPTFNSGIGYYLAIQMSSPGIVLFSDLRLSSLVANKRLPLFATRQHSFASSQATYSAPLINAKGELSKALERVNRQAAFAAMENEVKWLLNYTEVALRLECYEVSLAILQHVEERAENISVDTFSWFAVLVLTTLRALGEEEKARRFMFRYCNQMNFKNMKLVTLNSLIMNNHQEQDYVLPSGELNFALMDLRGIQPESLLKFLVRDDLNIGEENRMLISASTFGRIDLGLWRFHMNNFLKLKECPTIAEIDPNKSKRSVLHRLKFAPNANSHNGPLISIIMSVFNAESTLKMAVQSLLQQSYRNIEVLLCDDACTDDSLAAACSLAQEDQRIRVFRSIRNQGPYNIRNAMIGEARGDIITFHDADDMALPTRIFEQYQAYMSTGAQMIFCKWLRFRFDGGIFFFADQVAHRLSLVSLMAGKELFERFGPYRSVLCGGDSEFYEKVRDALGEQAVYVIDKPLVFASWSSTSLTRMPGYESNETGYRAPVRRSFSQMNSMQRMLGNDVLSDDEIDAALVNMGVYRSPSAIEEVHPDLAVVSRVIEQELKKNRKPKQKNGGKTKSAPTTTES